MLVNKATRLLTFTIIAAVIAGGNIFSQTERRDDLTALIQQNAVWDPAEFILDKLTTNRIVMLADAGRGDPLYYEAVIGSLNLWISKHEQASSNNGVPSKIFLFLEVDSARAGALNRYFQTGNPAEIIDPVNFWGDQFTTGTLEFYSELRTLQVRIDAFNRGRPADAQLRLHVMGAEKDIDLSNWTTEKRERFFIYERDEYSSQRIKEILDSVPDTKALIFYNSARLLRGSVPKQAGNQKSIGHYLAYYLSESFGAKGGAYICGQVDVRKSSWADQAIVHVNKTFAVDHGIFAGVPIEGNASFQPYDGSIYYFSPPRNARNITNVLSENLVDYILAHIDQYRDATKEFYRGKLDAWLYYLSTVAAADWHPVDHHNAHAVDSTIDAWKKWRGSANLDIVGDLSTLRYFTRCVERIRTIDQKQSTWHQIQLEKLIGFKVWFGDGASPEVRADSIWACINRYRKPIVVDNLIQLLWVGSKSENERAVAVLQKETGMEFTSAEEWTAWWEHQQAQ
jgi:hypothetical protein